MAEPPDPPPRVVLEGANFVPRLLEGGARKGRAATAGDDDPPFDFDRPANE